MKIKKKYIGTKVYSKFLGRLVTVCEENIEILKRDNQIEKYVIIEKKRNKQDSFEPTTISDNSES
jgi:hypothetical protein